MLSSEKSILNGPLSVAAAIVLLTLLVWQIFLVQESTLIKEQTQAVTDAFAVSIETTARTHENAVLHMAIRWERAGGLPQDLWEVDAQKYVKDLPGLTAFNWIDETYRVRWSLPDIGHKNFIGFNAGINSQLKAYLDGVREADHVISTGIFESSAGFTGISFYVPLHVEGVFSGFAGGLLDVEKFLQSQHREFANDIHIQVLSGGQDLFRSFDGPLDLDRVNSVSSTAEVGNTIFVINAYPTAEFVAQHETAIPNLILGIGMVLAALAALIVYQFNRASNSRNKMAEMDRTMERQTAALSLTNDAVFIQNVYGQIIDCNEAASAIFWLLKTRTD